MNDGDELLGRIPRDAKKEWKVVKGKYWNTEYVDIRLYENNKPTKKFKLLRSVLKYFQC